MVELTAFSHYYVYPVSKPGPDTSADIAVIAMWLWALAAVVVSLHKYTHVTKGKGKKL